MLVEQGIDVRRLPAARITPHAEHVLHDLICALAVLPNQSEVFRDVGADLSNQRSALVLLPVVRLRENRLQLFQEFLQQLLRYV